MTDPEIRAAAPQSLDDLRIENVRLREELEQAHANARHYKALLDKGDGDRNRLAAENTALRARVAALEKQLSGALMAIEWALKDDYDFGRTLRSPTAMALNDVHVQIRRELPKDTPAPPAVTGTTPDEAPGTALKAPPESEK